jgi:hypothetical protein
MQCACHGKLPDAGSYMWDLAAQSPDDEGEDARQQPGISPVRPLREQQHEESEARDYKGNADSAISTEAEAAGLTGR